LLIFYSIEQAEEKLKNFANSLEYLKINLSYLIKTGNPYLEIIKAADEMNVSLILMGHKGYNLTEELLLGSTAEKVARKSRRPVLLVK